MKKISKEQFPTLTLGQKEAVLGFFLGGVNLTLPKNFKNPTFPKLFFKKKKEYYLLWIYSLFQSFIVRAPKAVFKNEKFIHFTLSFPRIPEFMNLFNFLYRIGDMGVLQRRISNDFLNLLSPITLATWFMHNGSYTKNQLILKTQGLSEPDQKMLADGLKKKFHLSFEIEQRGGARGGVHFILKNPSEISKFYQLVEAHLTEEFKKIFANDNA